jgi:hypothetical protein
MKLLCPHCYADNSDAHAAIAAVLQRPLNRGVTCCTTCGAVLVSDGPGSALRAPSDQEAARMRVHPIGIVLAAAGEAIREANARRRVGLN